LALLGYVGVFGLVAMALVMFTGAMLHHAITPDFPWLLASGREILATHRLPPGDTFSWTMTGKPWVLYQWAFEVSLALKANFYGIPTLIRGFILWAVTFYVLIPILKDGKRGIPLGYTLLVASLALLTTAINLSLRPMMITVYFLALQLGIIQGIKGQRLSMLWGSVLLGLVYLMWGNMHTGVVMGLLSLGLFLLGDWLENRKLYHYSPELPQFEHRRLSLRTYGLLGLVALGASLINPYGVGIYSYLATLSGQTYLNESIQELQSPDFHLLNYQYFLVLLGLFCAVLPRIRKALPGYAWLHLVVFTAAMLFVQRFVVWTALFYAWMLPQGLYLACHASLPAGLQAWWTRLSVVRPVMVSLMILAGAHFWWNPTLIHSPPVRMSSCQSMEKGFAAYQQLKQPGDKLFNDAEIGSCMLLYHPEQQVFIDTRFDFYGASLMRDTKQTVAMIRDPEPVLDQWHINTLILKKDVPLIGYLRAQPGYPILYEDKAMVIFGRTAEARK
jgi:hypothetical protein